jgi:hypothetical protein
MQTQPAHEEYGFENESIEHLQALASAGRSNEAVNILLRHPQVLSWLRANVCEPIGANLDSVGGIAEPARFSAELVRCLNSDRPERSQYVERLQELLRDQITDSASSREPPSDMHAS